MKRIIINNKVYKVEDERVIKNVLEFAKEQTPHGIYAVEKDCMIGLVKEMPIEESAKFIQNGYRVYANK